MATPVRRNLSTPIPRDVGFGPASEAVKTSILERARGLRDDLENYLQYLDEFSRIHRDYFVASTNNVYREELSVAIAGINLLYARFDAEAPVVDFHTYAQRAYDTRKAIETAEDMIGGSRRRPILPGAQVEYDPEDADSHRPNNQFPGAEKFDNKFNY
jgi:hypothetical protein